MRRLFVPSAAWLVSPRFDLMAFLAPALVALALVPFAPPGGELPLPGWVIAVLLVDVAHVWATIYRSYLDPELRARRRVALLVTPIAAYLVGVVLHHRSAATFWTALAYLAVWHFVRQQYGWVALLHRKEAPGRADRALDVATVYAATLAPVLWWHAQLPREFAWFVSGDFIGGAVPEAVGEGALTGLIVLINLFCLRQLWRALSGEGVYLTKLIVVLSTAACWCAGIVLTNSDWAFTFTNVLIHGAPYFGLVWLYGARAGHPPRSALGWIFGRASVFYGTLVGLAYLEEWGWDRLVWHDHGAIFLGPEVALSSGDLAYLVPLLALPQATHYVLDAFIWRRADARALEAPRES